MLGIILGTEDHLQLHQRFITAGGFTRDLVNQAMEVQAMGTLSTVPELVSNAEELDGFMLCIQVAIAQQLLNNFYLATAEATFNY